MPAPPPLKALRVFEVAARSGSFVQAGTELGVTSAAVSQQIRVLEQYLNKRLFLRQGNRITLTDAGRAIYPRIEAALSDLADISTEILAGYDRARLVLSVLPSIAELWLAEALRGYDGLPGLDIRVEDDPVVFARDGVDLRITYGAHTYPDHQTETLFRDRLVPVVVSDYRLGDGGVGGLPDTAFIHTDWGPAYATQPSWATWFSSAGFARRPAPRDGLTVGATGLAAAAARAGLGVALVPERIVAADLHSGRLLVADAHGIAMSWDYVLVWPSALSRKPALRTLLSHLRS